MTINPTNIPPTPIDLKSILTSLADRWPKSDKIDTFSAKLAERPAQNTLIILGLGAVIFYAAERDHNPKVNTIFDALEYCSSSLSVGYTGIFPQTPLGKTVATFLMTYGPALSGAMIDGPKQNAESCHVTEQKMLETLERILAELRRDPSRNL